MCRRSRYSQKKAGAWLKSESASAEDEGRAFAVVDALPKNQTGLRIRSPVRGSIRFCRSARCQIAPNTIAPINRNAAQSATTWIGRAMLIVAPPTSDLPDESTAKSSLGKRKEFCVAQHPWPYQRLVPTVSFCRASSCGYWSRARCRVALRGRIRSDRLRICRIFATG